MARRTRRSLGVAPSTVKTISCSGKSLRGATSFAAMRSHISDVRGMPRKGDRSATGAPDVLVGGAGLELYFARLSDLPLGKKKGEAIVMI